MRFLYLLLLISLLTGCRDDARAQSATTGGPVVGNVDRSKRVRINPEDMSNSDNALILRMGDAEVARGEEACLPVEAANFRELLGFQFTMRFDSAALEFQRFRSFGVPQYGTGNFGVRFADRGYLSTLWTEGGAQPLSKPDGTRLFEVCFTNLMAAGAETEVRFQDGPTNFEVIGGAMDRRVISYANGTVRSR